MTHWRARAGQILVRDECDQWHWVTPMTTRRTEHRFLLLVVAIVMALLLSSIALLLWSARPARAVDMPPGFTCRQAQAIAMQIGANMRWDRERTRVIASTYGVDLTEAQLDALERCFRR